MDQADLEMFGRSIRYATETKNGADLDDALAEVGWDDALGIETSSALSLLFEAQGAANVTSSGLDLVVLKALQVEGASSFAATFPQLGEYEAPGKLVGNTVRVEGLGSQALLRRKSAVVVAAAADAHVAARVSTAELTLRPIGGLSPALGLVGIKGQALASSVERVEWSPAVALGQLAIAHDLLGASRRMLELARKHALEREQFGRPIAMFQAVRHRLAESLVAVRATEATIDAAWLEGSAQVAAIAKAVAGRNARFVAHHCQQVLAGIGFTAEHDFHLYMRRCYVLDQLFGAGRKLTDELGKEILRACQLPPLLSL